MKNTKIIRSIRFIGLSLVCLSFFYSCNSTDLENPIDNDTCSFYVLNDLYESEYNQIDTKRYTESLYANFWVDMNNELLPRHESKIDQIAGEFDAKIYDKVLSYFGEPSDIDSNGKIDIVFTELQEQYGGYFEKRQLFAVENSVQREAIVIDLLILSIFSWDRISATVMHELIHLVDFNQNILIEGSIDPTAITTD